MAETIWKRWGTDPPEFGDKVLILCDDGGSAAPVLVGDFDGNGAICARHGEDGSLIPPKSLMLRGSLWVPLPDNYRLRFMDTDYG